MSAQQTTRRPARVRADDRRPSLSVVAEPRRRHTLVYALTMVLILGGAVFGAVAMNALAAAEAVEARALEGQVAEGERTYGSLVAEVATLEDPGRIREAALDLGLVPSGPARHIQLERNLPADGAVVETRVSDSTRDPLKPVLSAER